MKNLDQIAEDLFNKIRSRFESISIGDDNGKITNDTSAARFYDFQFSVSGKDIGSVSIALFPDKLSVIYDNEITKTNEYVLSEWYAFLRELRMFSKRRLLSFETRNISKPQLKKRDYKFLSQETMVTESQFYGNKKHKEKKFSRCNL